MDITLKTEGRVIITSEEGETKLCEYNKVKMLGLLSGRIGMIKQEGLNVDVNANTKLKDLANENKEILLSSENSK